MAHKIMKVDKKLHRKCQICGGDLSIISYVTEKRGSKYTEQFIECSGCDNREYTGSKKKHKRTNMD